MTTPRIRLRPRARRHTIGYVILCVLVAFSLGPIVIFAFDSLKSQSELANNPLGFPTKPLWSNFVSAWKQAGMGTGLRNSAIVVVGTALGVCLIAGCAAYALARLNLFGGRVVMLYLLMATALPIQFFLVPLFFLWTRLHLYDTLPGLIIIYWAIFSPFATLLLRSYMIAVPDDYDAAARIDGAGEWKVLTRIILPLTWPGLVTVALVASLEAYNEFLLALTFIQTRSIMPVSTTLFTFQEGFSANYSLLSAAGVIMLGPMIVVFLLLQRRLVEGMTSAGLGGR